MQQGEPDSLLGDESSGRRRDPRPEQQREPPEEQDVSGANAALPLNVTGPVPRGCDGEGSQCVDGDNSQNKMELTAASDGSESREPENDEDGKEEMIGKNSAGSDGDESEGEGDDGSEADPAAHDKDDVDSWRQRFNSMVKASVANSDNQRCNVAFVKTHKTASTTITAVLYRYGLRHGRKVARFDVEGTAVTLEHSVKQVR